MSEENVERVRKGFEVFATQGIEAFLQEFAAPDGVWYTAPEFIDSPEYRGHEGLRSMLSIFTDTFDDWSSPTFARGAGSPAGPTSFRHGKRPSKPPGCRSSRRPSYRVPEPFWCPY